jgi:transposase
MQFGEGQGHLKPEVLPRDRVDGETSGAPVTFDERHRGPRLIRRAVRAGDQATRRSAQLPLQDFLVRRRRQRASMREGFDFGFVLGEHDDRLRRFLERGLQRRAYLDAHAQGRGHCADHRRQEHRRQRPSQQARLDRRSVRAVHASQAFIRYPMPRTVSMTS